MRSSWASVAMAFGRLVIWARNTSSFPTTRLKLMMTRTVVILSALNTPTERHIDLASTRFPPGVHVTRVRPTLETVFYHTLDQVTDNGLRLVYRGPLTKQGDFGGSTSGNHCHEDFLFPDGQRRRVILETGYIFGAESRFVDRTMQVENTAGKSALHRDLCLHRWLCHDVMA